MLINKNIQQPDRNKMIKPHSTVRIVLAHSIVTCETQAQVTACDWMPNLLTQSASEASAVYYNVDFC